MSFFTSCFGSKVRTTADKESCKSTKAVRPRQTKKKVYSQFKKDHQLCDDENEMSSSGAKPLTLAKLQSSALIQQSNATTIVMSEDEIDFTHLLLPRNQGKSSTKLFRGGKPMLVTSEIDSIELEPDISRMNSAPEQTSRMIRKQHQRKVSTNYFIDDSDTELFYRD